MHDGQLDGAPLFHLALVRDWEAAERVGEYRVSTLGKTLDEVGFIHCSYEHQVAGVARIIYRDETEPLVLLVIDRDQVTAPVVDENLEGGEQSFPHIYGALPVGAVAEARPARIIDGDLHVDSA